MADIKAGDIVQLKSGGPKMTVQFVNDLGYADCSWFGNGQDLKENSFKTESLKKIEE